RGALDARGYHEGGNGNTLDLRCAQPGSQNASMKTFDEIEAYAGDEYDLPSKLEHIKRLKGEGNKVIVVGGAAVVIRQDEASDARAVQSMHDPLRITVIPLSEFEVDEPYDVLMHFSRYGIPTIVEPRSPNCTKGRFYIAVDLDVLETDAHVDGPGLTAGMDPELAQSITEARAAVARYLARLEELAGRARNP